MQKGRLAQMGMSTFFMRMAILIKHQLGMQQLKNSQHLELLEYLYEQSLEVRREHQNTLQALLFQEKAILCALLLIEQGVIRAAPFNLPAEIKAFVQSVNKATIDGINSGTFQGQEVLAKAIYLLSEREVKAQLPKDVFLTLKTMSLNNLSCIYKSQGKLQNALSSINEALEVEQKMLTEGLPTSQERIITTIINKAVVMSAMGKNKQAVALLKDSFKYIPVQVSEDQTRKASSYLRCLINYNIGVEYENMTLKSTAQQYFKLGLRLAREIGNEYLEHKCLAGLPKVQDSFPLIQKH